MKKIVIKISEDSYKAICSGYMLPSDVENVINAIKNGEELPKGHGELVDKKDLSLMTVHLIDGVFICDAPTIIEADKEK